VDAQMRGEDLGVVGRCELGAPRRQLDLERGERVGDGGVDGIARGRNDGAMELGVEPATSARGQSRLRARLETCAERLQLVVRDARCGEPRRLTDHELKTLGTCLEARSE